MGKGFREGEVRTFVCFDKVKHVYGRRVIRLSGGGPFVGIKLTGVISCRLYGRKGNISKGEVKSSPGWRKV